MNKEQEIKVIISKNEYDKIFSLFVWQRVIVQNNYYYYYSESNFAEYGKESSTIRVRKIGESLWLQVKVNVVNDKSLHIKKEYERKIDNIPKKLTKEELSVLTEGTVNDEYFLIGSLKTRRLECQIYEGVLICLDKNDYLNKNDYEIEIEFKGEYPRDFVCLLEENGIDFSREIRGKYNRFMETFLRRKGVELPV